MKVIFGFLDYLLPSAIKERSREELFRGRMLLATLLMSIFFSVVADLPLLFSNTDTPREKILGLSITSLAVMLYFGCIFIFRRTASLAVAGNIFSIGAFSGLTLAIAISGGYPDSPFLQLLIMLPLFIFLICGRGWGYFWTAMVMVTFVTFFLLFSFDVRVPNFSNTTYQSALAFILWMMLCTSVMICLAAYDTISENLAKTLKAERDKYKHAAAHDALTKLANRTTFHKSLERNIEECRHSDSQLAILIVDLNGFKPINDNFGHHTGDFVLKIIGDRIKNAIRASDLAARLGGDEFGVLLLDIKSRSDSRKIADKIHDSIETPIIFNGNTMSVTASIGISIFPDHGEDPDTLQVQADSAMYLAKQSDSGVHTHATKY